LVCAFLGYVLSWVCAFLLYVFRRAKHSDLIPEERRIFCGAS
jgi:hypothetical protein